jgi:ribonuclease R
VSSAPRPRSGKAGHIRRAQDGAPSGLPTRDELLAFVRQSETPVGKREIARAFNIKGDDRIALKRMLRELSTDGEVVRGKQKAFAPPEALPAVGVVEVLEFGDDGVAIGRPTKAEDGTAVPRIEIVGGATGRAEIALAPGDRVLCYLKRRDAGDYEARVIRKVGTGPRRILGLYAEPTGPSGLGLVTPTDRKLRQDFQIAVRDRGDAKPGDVVWIEATGGALARRARVLERIGSMDEARTISLIAIAQNGIPVDFPEPALEQARKAEAAPLGNRLDLREVPLVTIDGEDARDFDDAVWAEPDGDPANAGGWHLLVAIADVAWYVRPGDPLDRAARLRGNSVYFPDRVVPMLPEELSNGWCSLVPREDRPALAAEMWIDAQGHLKGHRFHRAMIRSAARLTYTRVQAALDGRPDEGTGPLLDPVLRPLQGAFRALLAAREERGALDIDLPERQVTLGADGHIAEIRPRQRLDSHKLIEEFMIAANVAAAETLERRRMPCMYRVHDQPDQTRLEALREFLGSLGIGLAPGPRVRPAELNRILKRVEGMPYQRLVNETVLRSQSQAVYAPDNIGHFGLALTRYAHFTSPIRRYSDLLVHRALIEGLGLGAGGLQADAAADFVAAGEHISACERRAVAAERGALDRYMAAFMADRVGAEFDATISGVARFGLFVSLADTGADGLIPIRSLGADFFEHDERLHALRGRRSGLAFHLGDRLRVRLREADIATGSLQFELVEVVEQVRDPPDTKRGRTRASGTRAKPTSKGGQAGPRTRRR